MKIKPVIMVVTILLVLPLLSKSVSGDEVYPVTHGIETSISRVETPEEVEPTENNPRISATVVSNVPEDLELPRAHYESTPWISAVGMLMFTSTLLGISVNSLSRVLR